MNQPDSLAALLARVRPEEEVGGTRVSEILHRIGEDSYAPIILVPALLLVSPLSGIPGTPTLASILIVTLAVQWVLGRRHLWLPGFLMRRQISNARLLRAVDWLHRPAAWLDSHSRNRLTLLVLPPFSLIAKLCVLGIAMTWPLLELLPMVTSIGAGAVSLFAFGMMMRDGVYIITGFAAIGTIALLIFSLASQS